MAPQSTRRPIAGRHGASIQAALPAHYVPTLPWSPPPLPVATAPAISCRGSGRRLPPPTARCMAAPADRRRSSVSRPMPLAHPAAHLLPHVCINKDRWVAAVHFVPQQQGDSSRTHLTLSQPQFHAHGGAAAPASFFVPSPSPDCGRCTTQERNLPTLIGVGHSTGGYYLLFSGSQNRRIEKFANNRTESSNKSYALPFQVHASTPALPSRLRPLVAMDLKWMRAAGIHAPPRPKLVVPASAHCPSHRLKLCLGLLTSRVAPVSCRLLLHTAAGLHDASPNLLRLEDLRSAARILRSALSLSLNTRSSCKSVAKVQVYQNNNYTKMFHRIGELMLFLYVHIEFSPTHFALGGADAFFSVRMMCRFKFCEILCSRVQILSLICYYPHSLAFHFLLIPNKLPRVFW